MKILSLKELNRYVSEDPKGFIEDSEAEYRSEITSVADSILSGDDAHPIILISGPSGSAKTTTALRLATQLENGGRKVHIISMDNYFKPLSDPDNDVDENGNVDLESPKRLDMKLLNDHLEKMNRCEEITLPIFDFASQSRSLGKSFKRTPGELIVMEGIHALNPEITGNIGDRATSVYVSVRTRLENEAGTLLHPSKIRLMRRIVRDKLFRGRDIAGTLDIFRSVERGEQRFIMPYKNKATFDIDTFIGYEAAVYKPFVLKELIGIMNSYSDYESYSDVESFLREISEVEREDVPLNSLVREFVGGSNYSY